MSRFIKGTAFLVCLLLFIAPVPARQGLLLPGDPTRAAVAQIPLLPEYFSITAIPPVPAPLIDFAPSALGPAGRLTPPAPSEGGCDACSGTAVEPVRAEPVRMEPVGMEPVRLEPVRVVVDDAFSHLAVLEPVPILLPKLEGRLWMRAELGKIFNPDPWQTYLYLEEMTARQASCGRRDTQEVRKTLNAFYVKKEQGEERRKIREKWTQVLGIDVWYPYFKVKDAERWVKKRFSFRIRKLKCKPLVKRGLAQYICEKRF